MLIMEVQLVSRLLLCSFFSLTFTLNFCSAQEIQRVSVDPSGVCVGTPPLQLNLNNGHLSACIAGAWVIINGSGGSPTVVKVNGTNTTTQSPISFNDGTGTTVTNPSAGNILVNFTGAAGGVTTFNTRSGAVSLLLADVTSLGTLANNTSGNASTATLATSATSLAALPTLCPSGQAARGVLQSGNATGCFTPTGSPSVGSAGAIQTAGAGGTFADSGCTNPTSGNISCSSFNTTGGSGIVKGGDVTGTNIAGNPIIFAGGQSTGTGVGGDVSIQYSPAGSTGTAQNALQNAIKVTAANGNVEIFHNLTIDGTCTGCGGSTAPSVGTGDWLFGGEPADATSNIINVTGGNGGTTFATTWKIYNALKFNYNVTAAAGTGTNGFLVGIYSPDFLTLYCLTAVATGAKVATGAQSINWASGSLVASPGAACTIPVGNAVNVVSGSNDTTFAVSVYNTNVGYGMRNVNRGWMAGYAASIVTGSGSSISFISFTTATWTVSALGTNFMPIYFLEN